MGDFLSLLWIFILLQMFVPAIQKRILEAKRQFAMRRIEAKRRARWACPCRTSCRGGSTS